MYSIEIKPEAASKLKKLRIKDKKSFLNVLNKIKEVAKVLETNPKHYKNLRKPLQHYKRVHINKSFVLVFSADKKNKTMVIIDYDHHDNIYK